MIKSLKIGKYIFDRIKTITGYDSYPCIASNDVKFPYIVYNRNGLSTQLNKDGYTDDNVSFEISIYSDSYEESIAVADAVRSALEVMSTSYDKILQIDNSMITNSYEQFIDNAYVQNIQWSADITRFDLTLINIVAEYKTSPENFDQYYSFSGIYNLYDFNEVTSLSGTAGTDIENMQLCSRWMPLYTTQTGQILVTQNNIDVTSQCTYTIDNENITFNINGNQIIFKNHTPQTKQTGILTIKLGEQETTCDVEIDAVNQTLYEQLEYGSSEYYVVHPLEGKISLLQEGDTNLVLTGSTPESSGHWHYINTEWPKNISLSIAAAEPSYDNLITTDLFTISKGNPYVVNITPIAERPCVIGDLNFPRGSSTISVIASGTHNDDITWDVVDGAAYIKHHLCWYKYNQLNISSYAANADPNIYIRSRFTNSTFEKTTEAYEAYRQRYLDRVVGSFDQVNYIFNDVQVKTNIDGDPCYEIIIKPHYTYNSYYNYYDSNFYYYLYQGIFNTDDWYLEASIIRETE